MEYIRWYIGAGTLILLSFIITFSVKRAFELPDDFEFRDEDGDHIYYDRKLIQNKHNNKKQ